MVSMADLGSIPNGSTVAPSRGGQNARGGGDGEAGHPLQGNTDLAREDSAVAQRQSPALLMRWLLVRIQPAERERFTTLLLL